MVNKEETGILTLYSDVQATSVRWLWYPFIAVGKITLLQGEAIQTCLLNKPYLTWKQRSARVLKGS